MNSEHREASEDGMFSLAGNLFGVLVILFLLSIVPVMLVLQLPNGKIVEGPASILLGCYLLTIGICILLSFPLRNFSFVFSVGANLFSEMFGLSAGRAMSISMGLFIALFSAVPFGIGFGYRHHVLEILKLLWGQPRP